MTTYLICFICCSGLLLLTYHVFLSRESLYRFNRFYLLFSLVFSIIIPAITIKIPHRVVADSNPIAAHLATIAYQQPVDQLTKQPVTEISKPITQQPIVTGINYQAYLLPAIYVVALLLLIRFMLNVSRLKQKISKRANLDIGNATLVLLDEDITPHSFLKYIFINKDQYQKGAVEPEIICHEQTHVRQLHSVDVLIIELLQVVFWFNPFIPFYRKAIQLNHEFLADEAVIKDYTNTPAYQYLLLAKAQQGNSLYLTSQFNYLTIKKRLIMMTKTTSEKTALCKKLALLPVLAVAALLFSHKVMAYSLHISSVKIEKPVKVAEQKNKDTIKRKYIRFPMPDGMRTEYAAKDAPKSVIDTYEAILRKYDLPDDGGGYKSISAQDKAELHALFIQMSAKQQDDQVVYFSKPNKPAAKNVTTATQLNLWLDAKKYGVWIDGKRIKNAILVNYKPEDFDNMWVSRLTPIAVKYDGFHFQVGLMTKPYYAEYYNRVMADQSDQLHHIHTNAEEWRNQVKNRKLRLEGAEK